MTLEELKGIVPKEQHGDFDTLIADTVKEAVGKVNPLDGLTEESARKLVESSDVLKSYRDRFLAQGLETWQKNNLDKEYQKRYATEHPEETPEQKRLKALEIKAEEADRRAIKAEQRSIALKALGEHKLPASLADKAIGEKEEETLANIEFFRGLIEGERKSVADGVKADILKGAGRTVIMSDDAAKKYYTEDQIKALSDAEWTDPKVVEKVNASIQFMQDQDRIKG